MNLNQILKEQILNEVQSYIGQCDVIRRSEEGESFWQTLMNQAEKISKEDFLSNINPDNILEDDETVDDFIAADPDSYFAKSIVNNNLYYFIGTHGFEFIWLKK